MLLESPCFVVNGVKRPFDKRVSPPPRVPIQRLPDRVLVERGDEVRRQPIGGRERREFAILEPIQPRAVGANPERAASIALHHGQRVAGRPSRVVNVSNSSAALSAVEGPAPGAAE